MTTILLDSEYSDDLLHLNQEPLFEYGTPFVMEDLYVNEIKSNESQLSDCSSEEDLEFDFKMIQQPHAPPPSPQDTCMLDIMFSNKLTSSLEACLVKQEEQTLDKLLRNDNNNYNRGICKKSHKRTFSTSWQQRAKIINIAKTTEQAEKLKKALQKHLMDEETSVMINELKDMGLK